QWQRRTDRSILMDDMDDSRLFMQWAVSTLEQQDPGAAGGGQKSAGFLCLQALRDSSELAEAQNSLSSGDDTGGCGGIISPASDAAVHQGSWSTSSPTSGGPFASSSTGSSDALSTSWNFGAVLPPQPAGSGGGGTRAPLLSGVSQLMRRAPTKGPPHAQDHVMAERKRREKINQRFIELSALIPGLKKVFEYVESPVGKCLIDLVTLFPFDQMDKGTILTVATRYVKELQERVRSLEAAGGNHRS
uniref:BHLH domain-containing protein n=1 Tax=Aegilops tauschii subsp. strangulata TaxID=200361 RepID=A0A453IZ29_AEGTS